MATKHILKLTCDGCKIESDNPHAWARIDVSGFSPDQHYDLCPECWKGVRTTVIHPRHAKGNG